MKAREPRADGFPSSRRRSKLMLPSCSFLLRFCHLILGPSRVPAPWLEPERERERMGRRDLSWALSPHPPSPHNSTSKNKAHAQCRSTRMNALINGGGCFPTFFLIHTAKLPLMRRPSSVFFLRMRLLPAATPAEAPTYVFSLTFQEL